MSEEEFEQQDQFFTTVLSNGKEVDLIPNGSNTRVKKNNMQEYINLVVERRFKESEEAVYYIRKGLLQVIQDPSIFLYSSWNLMDIRITGEKTVETERLKSITIYNFDENHAVVGRFWRAFERMSQE